MEWHDILVASERAAVAFILVMGATRLLNKQFVARLTYFDFTVGVTVGSLVGHLPNDYNQPFWPVAMPIVVITALGILTSWLAMRLSRFRAVLQGQPTVLIQNGKILEQNMRGLRYNMDQLDSQLRMSGIFDMAHVEFAVLEPGGQLSVLPKSQYRPVTPADLNLATHYEGMGIELIMDGTIIQKNLRENGLTADWLRRCLQERDIHDPALVYYAVLNTRGELFVDLYADRLQRPIDLEGQNPSSEPSPGVH
ncbi:MAG TPA: DUF421 domain-containing protein [Symbiobacteriaceae bacterium]|jgi:uncharacterized membrane protein YcaP (DUF421 family)